MRAERRLLGQLTRGASARRLARVAVTPRQSPESGTGAGSSDAEQDASGGVGEDGDSGQAYVHKASIA